MDDFNYSDEFLREVAKLFKAFSQFTRLQIIRELHGGPRDVSQLNEAIGGSQPNISKHLKILKDEGIVSSKKEGNRVIYEIAREEVTMICDYVCGYMQNQLEKKMEIPDVENRRH